ncbi:uncharacterized protein PFL1_03284 [Pseudozyma flocculosa PF-1]|uniref:Uncharacterized protein n=2 Tax=Pseudozyma flocculosa TaxID=84751 RepID=A0A5C3F8D7_9BASI|nr:uncharacterized protein PFL1_03284 [Pseudozyma flocculosa PF-1]EPQ28994.1 hypothetical protein PFL1_03284 [Pseudozyma flocculosa PF-1]SPO39987.1 uncharacterized protein PSFLO_05469 [Pseudozyma flocculosa]
MAVFSASTFVQSIPPGTRILTASLLAFTLLLAFLRLTRTEEGLHFITFSSKDSALAFPWLVIVPGASWYYPWTLLTAGLCETSFFEFLISLFSLPLAGRYLERQWGATELLRFSAIVIVGSNIIAWGLAFIMFAVLRFDVLIYGTQYHGLEALQVAFLVAFTQLIPEHQVQLFRGALKLRVKDLPMLYVTFSNIACIVGYTSPFILIQFGWLISWAYLRYFQANESGYKGDRSEAFAFVNWFPPIAHRPVQFISDTLFALFVKLKIVQPWSGGDYADLEMAAASVGGGPAVPAGAGGARAEAERRRAMALKALDQRLAGGGSGGGGSGSRPGSGAGRSSAGHPNLQRSDSASSQPQQAKKAGREQAAAPVPSVVFEAPRDDDDEAKFEEEDSGDISQQGKKPAPSKELT